ncbi:tail completion protein gp17 [Candidatus Magnetaquicoccus inordinatus]|uniref:tail completion protein gp17 n=1 Tax=Candidatus Magnetaquicoccus inordinatus TaxID=2496818 RepID=UPI00102B1507|nr:DUF3168 domain-containing protein [Candidatus Magnetaquicoccus inordinatus]
MTTLQEQIVALVIAADVAGGRIFPHAAPNDTQTPFITYFRVSSVPETNLNGSVSLVNTRIQFDLYDKTYAGVVEAAKALDDAIAASNLKAVRQLSQDLFEPETREHRVSVDYSFWHNKE